MDGSWSRYGGLQNIMLFLQLLAAIIQVPPDKLHRVIEFVAEQNDQRLTLIRTPLSLLVSVATHIIVRGHGRYQIIMSVNVREM